MSDERVTPRFEGFTTEDLPMMYRVMFDQCVASAVGRQDPAVDFDGFVKELYVDLAHAFDWLPEDEGVWPPDVASPPGWRGNG